MDAETLLEVASTAAARVREALDSLGDWGPAHTRPGQYRSDIVADDAALSVFEEAGLSVLSEESGVTGSGELVVVLDPVDGSTNASRGVPWYATSICVVDGEGPVVALVVNQANGTRYHATRGGGAFRDGRLITPRGEERLSNAVIGLAGYPPVHLGWRQYRALGAAALDLCGVADGTLDGYADCGPGGHGVWDYLGALLVCREAGAHVADASGRELVVLDHRERRSPVAACTAGLLQEMLKARASAFGGSSS